MYEVSGQPKQLARPYAPPGSRYISLRLAVRLMIRFIRSLSVCLHVEKRKSNSAR
jgi:hypothetical protein